MATDLKLSGIPKADSFLLAKKLPLDVRTVVKDYEYLQSLVTKNVAFAGLVVYVTGEEGEPSKKGLYICESTADGGSWRVLPKINIHTGSPDDLATSFENAAEGDIVIIVSSGEDSGEEA